MKVLVIYASFGQGHKRAAEAVLEALQDRGVNCELHDLLDFLPAPMARFYSSSYDFMITSGRSLWRLTYDLVNAPKGPYSPAKAITQRWQFPKLKKFLIRQAFTHIVSTHFTPSALMTDWRQMGELRCRCFSVITDHEAHRCWKRTGLDRYFVASEEVASQMNKIGVPNEDITISGIPISKAFATSISREQARETFNLPAEARVILMLCSALTSEKSIQILEELARVEHSLRYLVLAGLDSTKEQKLKNRFAQDDRFTIFGFSKEIPVMMKAADLIVSKPGGLIVSEALAVGLPQILLEPIPGQEEANARYAIAQGSAISVKHRSGIYAETLRQILSDSGTLKRMREAATAAGKPHAATQIVESVLSTL